MRPEPDRFSPPPAPDRARSHAWQARFFSAMAMRDGGVVRRSKQDVEREMGYEALRAAVRARGFHLLECGDHYLVVCTARRMRIHR